MTQTVQGVIAREKGAPVEVVDILIPEPGPNDVVVKVQATGVCHTDLAYRDGDIEDAFPFLLGHETAGVVETVGEEVTHVKEGDFVVLNWRAVCGECRACRKGDTKCTKVDPEADPAAAGLLGCGIMAGLGAAVNTGDVQRGESVVVFGLGGVGLAAVAGAALAGATTVIAVDVDERKCDAATETFGATHAICAKDMSEDEVIERVRELTGGFGTDVAIDAVGIQPTWRQAFYSRDFAGRMVMVGVPNQTDHVDIPAIDLYARGGSIKPAWYGDCLPERDFPAYVELYQQGRFPLGEFVSERIGVGDIEDAFAKMKRGDVLRSVVEF